VGAIESFIESFVAYEFAASKTFVLRHDFILFFWLFKLLGI